MKPPRGICEFCGQQPGNLLCDGRISMGDIGHSRTCDRQMCRACAGPPVALVRGGNAGPTRDLCPACREANRKIF